MKYLNNNKIKNSRILKLSFYIYFKAYIKILKLIKLLVIKV